MGFGETTSPEIERVAHEIVDAAFKISSKLGPGLLESTYRVVMIYELRKRGFDVKSEVPVPVVYEEVRLDAGYRLDLLVNDCVVIELKSVEKLIPLHEAQLLTYLKLTGYRLGILINFNTRMIKDGIKRICALGDREALRALRGFVVKNRIEQWPGSLKIVANPSLKRGRLTSPTT